MNRMPNISDLNKLPRITKFVVNTVGYPPKPSRIRLVKITKKNKIYMETAVLIAKQFKLTPVYGREGVDIYDYKSVKIILDLLSKYSTEKIKLLKKHILELRS